MIRPFIRQNSLRLSLIMVLVGLLILIFQKLGVAASDPMLVIGVTVTMIGYLTMVGTVFSESAWLQFRYSNSKSLFYLLLFTVFLFSFSQGIFSDFGSLFYFAVAAVSIIVAATIFPRFQTRQAAEETTF